MTIRKLLLVKITVTRSIVFFTLDAGSWKNSTPTEIPLRYDSATQRAWSSFLISLFNSSFFEGCFLKERNLLFAKIINPVTWTPSDEEFISFCFWTLLVHGPGHLLWTWACVSAHGCLSELVMFGIREVCGELPSQNTHAIAFWYDHQHISQMSFGEEAGTKHSKWLRGECSVPPGSCSFPLLMVGVLRTPPLPRMDIEDRWGCC